MKTVIVTGGAGFIGHHLVDHLLTHYTDIEVVVIDKLTYASYGLQRFDHIYQRHGHDRLRVFTLDVAAFKDRDRTDTASLEAAIGTEGVVGIVHLAADTHVPASISAPGDVITNNINAALGVLALADACPNLRLLVNFSTDEVFGPAENTGRFVAKYAPRNPYAASKAACDHVFAAYAHTYHVPVATVNSCNVIGERQHTEKFIPTVVRNVLGGLTTAIHVGPRREIGTRYYISVREVCKFVAGLVFAGTEGTFYLYDEAGCLNNLDLFRAVHGVLKPGASINGQYTLVEPSSTRPGHDLHYYMFTLKPVMPERPLLEELAAVVRWYSAPENSLWLTD